ncbi:MAG: pantetheine-phosphate adenylyltransferase [Planctomycetes bacterium]|nr:pantetheine-phosphate adenylyltransferase [Planctomycetota bacterium]
MARRRQHIIAVYPGSFDPVTYGHLDVIRRASQLFNELVIGVGVNPGKEDFFTQRERLGLLEPHLRNLPNVRAAAYSGLTIDFLRQCKGHVLVKGIRDVADLSHEILQANVNLTIGGVETVFLLTSDQYVLTSSTYIKQIYEMGGEGRERIERIVPSNVAELMARKLETARRRRRAQKHKLLAKKRP